LIRDYTTNDKKYSSKICNITTIKDKEKKFQLHAEEASEFIEKS
jgi:hypothetical protein